MKTIIVLFSLICSQFALAETGFVKIPSGHSVYVNYEPARGDRPTVVLINGLVYELERWDAFANVLKEAGFGVLRYHFRGQSKTLRKELEAGTPSFYQEGLSREGFAKELLEVLDALKLKKVTVVGLSFGAGIAAEFGERYPERTSDLFLLAPLVVSLDRYDPNGAWLNWNLDALKLYWGPQWGPYVYDFYYNWIFRAYMNQKLVPERIPDYMRDIPDDYKEAMFHLVRSMRDFDLKKVKFNLPGHLHMMTASEEDAPALRDQFNAWEGFEKPGTFAYLTPAWHAIPDSSGAYAANLLLSILKGSLGQGKAFYAPVGKRVEVQEYELRKLEERAFSERKN